MSWEDDIETENTSRPDKTSCGLTLAKGQTCEEADIYQTFQTVITKHNRIIATAVPLFLPAPREAGSTAAAAGPDRDDPLRTRALSRFCLLACLLELSSWKWLISI